MFPNSLFVNKKQLLLMKIIPFMKRSFAILFLILFLSVMGVKSWHALNHKHITDEHVCNSHDHKSSDLNFSDSKTSLHCFICDFDFTVFDFQNVELFFQNNIIFHIYLENYKNNLFIENPFSFNLQRGPPSYNLA